MKKMVLLAWIIIYVSVPITAFGQTRQVSGTVKNSKGEAVPSASIQQKGTTTGVTADENGKFTITVNGSNPVLIISSAGFAEAEVAIGTADSYETVLQ